MKVFFDTSAIVDIERKKEAAIALVKRLIVRGDEILISTITLSEIFTGSYMSNDSKAAVSEARRVLAQFLWNDFDSHAAEITGRTLAYLLRHGKPIEYQDAAIGATATAAGCDALITLNKKHFVLIPELIGKVHTPEEFLQNIK